MISPEFQIKNHTDIIDLSTIENLTSHERFVQEQTWKKIQQYVQEGRFGRNKKVSFYGITEKNQIPIKIVGVAKTTKNCIDKKFRNHLITNHRTGHVYWFIFRP